MINEELETLNAAPKDTCRQIVALMRKNGLLKWRMKGQVFWELLLPVLAGALLKFLAGAFECGGLKIPEDADEIER